MRTANSWERPNFFRFFSVPFRVIQWHYYVALFVEIRVIRGCIPRRMVRMPS
jgi:hypothetical protein